MFNLLIASSGVVTVACSSEPFPDTPLFKGLNRVGYDEGRAVIEQRVSSRFPVGSNDAGLAEYLKLQGLTVKRDDDVGLPELPVYGRSFVIRKRQGCDMIVRVDWRSDRGGVIRSLSVRYSDVGCM